MKLHDATAGFSWVVRVYWEDTDAGGIVFYANYLKFFERARTEWLRALGLEQHSLRQDTGGIFVVSDAHLKYLRPARLDDAVRITVNLREMGRSSLTIEQEALLISERDPQAAPELLCTGRIRIGWVDGATLKPARIPPIVLQTLQP